MKAKHLIVIVLTLGLFVSCKSMLNMVTPKASPEMTAMVMDKAAKIRFSPARKLGKSRMGRMDLKAGQWVTTLSTDKGASANVTLSTTKVISVSGSTVVIETESWSALEKGERQLAQITMANYPVKGMLSYSQAEYDKVVNNMRIVKMITKTGDQPAQEMPEQLLMLSMNMGKNIAAAAVRTSPMTTEPASTEAIESPLCYAFNYTVSIMGITRGGKCVVHSDIPINGTVRMDSEDMVMETIAFGTSGATSQL